MLYFEGVINIHEFFSLFDDRFASYLDSDIKQNWGDMIGTRDFYRRFQSEILKPWNDIENQRYEKIPGSSYYKIDKEFRLPICSGKENPKNREFYKKLLNDDYLSLATGSENYKFKVRNLNEEIIYKTEDDMFKIDFQIDMFEKCLKVIQEQIAVYEELKAQNKYDMLREYTFPR